ncbi:MAG: helix-turn-helix domain-containing protein [Firmicutes bacterium]|nr:helix-turn-helix domain-containing protein [Bacillota bacterium]
MSSKCTIKHNEKYCRLDDFFSKIPREVYVTSFNNIENDAIKKILNDPEDRNTVHVFLHNNLNINAASKQLYMHRNTLIYRLDKIKNATGLDLKKFCDAFIFHVLMFKHKD